MSLFDNLGEKIEDMVPDSVREYVAEHPRVLYLVSVPIVALAVSQLLDAMRVHGIVERLVAERAADLARAASEALGG